MGAATPLPGRRIGMLAGGYDARPGSPAGPSTQPVHGGASLTNV